jgi:hypothetical protein
MANSSADRRTVGQRGRLAEEQGRRTACRAQVYVEGNPQRSGTSLGVGAQRGRGLVQDLRIFPEEPEERPTRDAGGDGRGLKVVTEPGGSKGQQHRVLEGKTTITCDGQLQEPGGIGDIAGKGDGVAAQQAGARQDHPHNNGRLHPEAGGHLSDFQRRGGGLHLPELRKQSDGFLDVRDLDAAPARRRECSRQLNHAGVVGKGTRRCGENSCGHHGRLAGQYSSGYGCGRRGHALRQRQHPVLQW